jgi:thiol-disulfide isomerase/thioredoxin
MNQPAHQPPFDMKRRTWIAALIACATVAGSNHLQAATLKVGDAAPKLQVSKWVQGSPVAEFSRDKAYIVEFWATWCGPCRTSIPHLNELHNKFKDKGLIVIGQDCWEQDTKLVEPFIKKMGDTMTYRVALDLVPEGEKSKGRMAETWMEAAGQDGIPTAFVVNKQGIIAWIGHPMSLKESILEQVLDGTLDVKKAATEFALKQKREEETRDLYREINTAMRGKKWDDAEAAVAKMEKLLPEDERDDMGMMRFNILIGRKDYPAAYALAGKLSDAKKDDVMFQNELAWQIATKKDIETRDLDLAEKIAMRANAASKGKNAEILDTVARVLFMKGQKAKAIEYEEKAVEAAVGKRKETFEKVLAAYKEGTLPKSE